MSGVVFNPLDLATASAQQLGWNPDVVLAQWRVETANFTSPEFQQDNNFAGIWYSPGNTPGATQGGLVPQNEWPSANTPEYYAHYSNVQAGAQGYVDFAKANPRYANVGASKDPSAEALALQQDGWAGVGNTSYASTLDHVMGTPYSGNATTSGTPQAVAAAKSNAGDFIGQLDSALTLKPFTVKDFTNFGGYVAGNMEAFALRTFLIILAIIIIIFACIEIIGPKNIASAAGTVARTAPMAAAALA